MPWWCWCPYLGEFAAPSVAIEFDLDLKRGDWGMQGRMLLNFGLMDPADDDAHDAPEDLDDDNEP